MFIGLSKERLMQQIKTIHLLVEFIDNEKLLFQTIIWKTMDRNLERSWEEDAFFIRGALKAFSLLTGKASCK